MLDSKWFEGWSRRYLEAKTDLNNRDESIQNCVNELEQDMDLLGVTGVEDKL
jgi:magnesium-transporting ATPase (P-type)